MSNQLLNISQITNEALMVFENNLVFSRAASRDYDDQFARTGAKIGNVVNARRPVRFTTARGPALSLQDAQETYVPVALNYQDHVDFTFTTADLALSVDEFSNRFLKPAIAQLANKVDYQCFTDCYLQVPDLVGTAGGLSSVNSTLLAQQYIMNARRRLNENAAPMDQDRNFIIDPGQEATIVPNLTTLFNPNGNISRVFESGSLGDNVLGFNFAMSQNVPTFTAGTLNATMATSGAQSGSLTADITTPFSLTMATQSGGPTITKGTVITLSNVYNVNPQNRQSTGVLKNFVVAADVTSNGVGTWTLQILPTPVFSGPNQNCTSSTGNIASGATATVLSGLNSAVNSNGMAFHKNAFVIATADLPMPEGVHFAGRKSTKNGYSLRVVRQYDINTDQIPCRIDVLYGSAVVNPEMAVRVTS